MNRKHTVSINPVSTVSSRLVLGMILFGTFPAVQAADFNCSLSNSGNWSDNSNWSNCGGNSPNNNGAKYDVTLNGGKNVVVDQAVKVDAFSLSSGAVSGNSNLSVMKNATWVGGQIGGDAGKVLAKGGLSIEGNAQKTLGRPGGTSSQGGLINFATGVWTGQGNIGSYPTGRFVNEDGASLDIQTDADFLNGFFENKGSLTKSFGATDGSNKTVISAEFTNTGTVDVQQGVLSIAGGDQTGSFTTGANGVLEFAGISSSPAINLNSGSSVSGNVRITRSYNGVQVHNGATYDVASTELINGGKLWIDNNVTAKTGSLDMASSQIAGNGNLEVAGKTTWSGGSIGGDAGKVLAKGGLSIEGNAQKTLGRPGGTSSQGGLINLATGVWTGQGNIGSYPTGRFVNEDGASLDIQTDADFLNGFFENKGSLTKSFGATDGSNKTIINARFDNTGTVDVQQGELNASGVINQQGTIRIAENAVFSAADLTNQGLVTGEGTLKMTSNTAFINDGRIAPGDGVGELTVDGNFAQTNGGVFEVTLAGTGNGDFDVMTVLGDFSLEGIIEVSLDNGFIPDLNDTFTILTSTGNWLDNSKFDSIVSVTNPGIKFSAIYGSDFVKLGVSQVPVPAAVWLFGSALIGLVGVSRRKIVV